MISESNSRNSEYEIQLVKVLRSVDALNRSAMSATSAAYKLEEEIHMASQAMGAI